jgi:hypothetical protein
MPQTIISVKCTDQVLTPIDTPIIAAGGVDENKIAFDFCSKWDGFTKKAVFRYNKSVTAEADVGEDNSCIVPPEVTAQHGKIFFGVYGVNAEGVRRTSTLLKYTIVQGAGQLL